MDDIVVHRCEVLSESTAQIIWSVQTATQNRTLDPSKSLGTRRYRIHDCGQELHIQYAELSDRGNYVCTVKNKHGLVELTSSVRVRGNQIKYLKLFRLRSDVITTKVDFHLFPHSSGKRVNTLATGLIVLVSLN